MIIPPATRRAVRWRICAARPSPRCASGASAPRAALAGCRSTSGRGQDWGGVGLDAGVNDADGGTRRTQVMWMGTAENYLNPAYLPGIFPGEVPDGATRRVLR